MFERFSAAAARTVELARTEADQLGHPQVGTEHLLLGILAAAPSAAADALTGAGATLQGCREMTAEAVGEVSALSEPGEPLYTERARRALERSARLALRRRAEEVSPSHVLSSVLDVEGRAGQVLRGLSVDPAALRRVLDGAAERQAASPEPGTGDGPAKGPRCAGCGADLESNLAHKSLPSSGHTGVTEPVVIVYCCACGAAVGTAGGA